ncbi:MAG: serine acetyltransferase [Spirochaetes bacterium]|nr:serine acetyltransferase [Spirochaetota bacterium]
MKNRINLQKVWTVFIEKKIDNIISKIKKSYEHDETAAHIQKYPLPSKESIIKILKDLFDIIYPGYFIDEELNLSNVGYFLGHKLSNILENLSREIAASFRHEHKIDTNQCELCDESLEKGIESTLDLLNCIPDIRRMLILDIKAGYNGDPAAKSFNEIVFSYPGLHAITVHRIAHNLFVKKIPLLPRIMSEYSHSITGIDIHPGAKICENFFIDHGTGVVIGETCEIGNNVKIYQGVTLGALSFPKDKKGALLKGGKRHPTIEDNVTIYSGATILGGQTVIGKNSIIGGNVWITNSIPANSKVTLADVEKTIIVKKINN